MVKAFFRSEADVSGLILRVMLGVVMFPHGAQKALGWFGGHGLAGTLGFFTETMGVPLIFAVLVIAAEFLGSLGLIAGFLTRLCALGVVAVMTGAIFMVHLSNGFFMNWSGKQAGEGFEFHLLAIAMGLALLVKGGGAWSVDRGIAHRLEGGR